MRRVNNKKRVILLKKREWINTIGLVIGDVFIQKQQKMKNKYDKGRPSDLAETPYLV